jgi:hypothetical protein
MNIINLIEEIEKVDADVYERLSPRRTAMKDFFSFGSKVALAAMPLALGSMFKKAYGQTVPAPVVNVLQYALTLEHFEYNFYLKGCDKAPIMAADLEALKGIRDSEGKHVSFLQQVIKATGATPVTAKAAYDFTAAGTFPSVFSDYATFLAVAQVLEDTGVRAYKGRAAELLGEKIYLTAALGIHAVEARHASKIRYMRRLHGFAPANKSYITGGNDTGIAAVNGNYAGEENVAQAGVNITSLPGIGGNISVTTATEAFDEPLTAAQVLALVAPFGVS